MPFKRMTDYLGLFIWIITLVFILGGLFNQQNHNTKAIANAKDHKVQLVSMDKEILALKLQQRHQQVWQQDFGQTMKDLVTEIRVTNTAVQATNSEVLRNSIHLKAIKEQLSDEHL